MGKTFVGDGLAGTLGAAWLALLDQLSPAVHNQRLTRFGDNGAVAVPLDDELYDMLVFDTIEGHLSNDDGS